MAKFRLNSASVFTIGANAIDCFTDITINEVTDDFISNCAGNTTKQHVSGLLDITGSASFEIETDADTELGYIDPGTTGALVLRPAGITSGDLDITSTNITVMNRDQVYSSTGLSTGSFTFTLDDMTIGAIT